MKKTLAIVLTLCMLLTSCAALAETTAAEAPATYTYHTYSSSLGNNWNPHTWETNADDSILSYLSSLLHHVHQGLRKRRLSVGL